MSSNQPKTRQEKGTDAAGASSVPCCQPCMPGRAFAFKCGAEQRVEAAEEQTAAAPSDSSPTRGGGCCGEGSGE